MVDAPLTSALPGILYIVPPMKIQVSQDSQLQTYVQNVKCASFHTYAKVIAKRSIQGMVDAPPT